MPGVEESSPSRHGQIVTFYSFKGGTGRTMALANVAWILAANGKKVLFVSEKMAALEVVFNRLRAVGLGDYCLELHSHKASKRAVVEELKRCLEERRQPDKPMTTDDFGKLQQRREHLTQYVQALHKARAPLQRSAWWALGELTRCASMPTVTWSLAEGIEMTPTWLDEACQAVQRAQDQGHDQDPAGQIPGQRRGQQRRRHRMVEPGAGDAEHKDAQPADQPQAQVEDSVRAPRRTRVRPSARARPGSVSSTTICSGASSGPGPSTARARRVCSGGRLARPQAGQRSQVGGPLALASREAWHLGQE